MSKALELAKDYARYCLLRGGITFSHQFDELAKELRRLAQVEAEHEALKKAISDAVPVAWRLHPFDYGVGHEGVYAVTQFPQQVDAWSKKGWAAQPLYTLEGIRTKP